jgi:hypothetical protein
MFQSWALSYEVHETLLMRCMPLVHADFMAQRIFDPVSTTTLSVVLF